MKRMKRRVLIFALLLLIASLFANNAPVVENVTANQRTDGSKIVDIYYDVTDVDGDTLSITLQVSDDGGVNYNFAPIYVSGDIGSNILSGTGKHIIWNAGSENYILGSTQHKFKVIADDYYTPPPAGFVFVEGGTFQMGDRLDGMSRCLPLHDVTLSSFYMAETEVTQSEYTAIMGSNPAHNSGVGDNYPVYLVNWYSAVKYCNKKSLNESLTPCYSVNGDTNPDNWGGSFTPDVNWSANGYRLPTEAEWEYAARGGIHEDDNYRYSGCHNESDLPNYAWYSANNSPNGSKEVGTKLPNQLGLYDMSGNVYEWCWDWYAGYSSSSQTNPHGANSGSYRVIRGGCWINSAYSLRVAFRNNNSPSSSNCSLGFRLLRSLN